MTNQTLDSTFEPFGTFYDEPLDIQKHGLERQEFTSDQKRLTELFYFPCEIYIECPPGLADTQYRSHKGNKKVLSASSDRR